MSKKNEQPDEVTATEPDVTPEDKSPKPEAQKEDPPALVTVTMSCNWWDDKLYEEGSQHAVTPDRAARMRKLKVVK